MDGEDFILILLLTTIILSYFLVERKHFLILWNKCISIFSYFYKYSQIKSNHSTKRFSLLEYTQWHYRGEGNEYLAISLPEQRKILRLRKSPLPENFLIKLKDWFCQNLCTILTEQNYATNFEKLNLEYYKVLSILIGECYVQPSEDVLLVRTEINKINKIIERKRPEYRRKKRIAFTCCSLLTDYAYLPTTWDSSQFVGPTFAVEIKPKQGCVPKNQRFFYLCTYCLNQYIKMQNGETSRISEYCPMDLFSGQPSRMKHAVKCLLETPQNNLKIFQEGILVHGENNETSRTILCNLFKDVVENSTNEFCDLITKALLKQLYTSNNICTNTKHNTSTLFNNNDIKNGHIIKICNITRSKLPEGCVLKRILNLQELDQYGPENMKWLLDTYPYKQSNYAHAANVVSRAKNFPPSGCVQCFFENKGTVQKMDIIQKYLMSAIAKDCSLMLTFRKLSIFDLNIPKENIIETNSGLYAFQIGVFDLYPKPLTCISKQAKKRIKLNKIYNCFMNGNYSNKTEF